MSLPINNSFQIVDRLVNDNIKLAYHFVNKWRDIDPDEGLSLALAGLLEASRSWDALGEIPFGTWASRRIAWKAGVYRTKRLTQKRGGNLHTISLDAPFEGIDSTTLHSRIADPNDISSDIAAERENEYRILGESLQALPSRTAHIIRAHYGLDGNRPQTTVEIATGLNLSTQRVSQLERVGFKKISLMVLKHKGLRELGEMKLTLGAKMLQSIPS